jgi:hypothetical protein
MLGGMTKHHTHASAIIDAFGGTTKLARLMDAPISTVHSWRTLGIPASRMSHIGLLAKVHAVKLPVGQAA